MQEQVSPPRCNLCGKRAIFGTAFFEDVAEPKLCREHFYKLLTDILAHMSSTSQQTCQDFLELLGYDWELSGFFGHDSWMYHARAKKKDKEYVFGHNSPEKALLEVLQQILREETKS